MGCFTQYIDYCFSRLFYAFAVLAQVQTHAFIIRRNTDTDDQIDHFKNHESQYCRVSDGCKYTFNLNPKLAHYICWSSITLDEFAGKEFCQNRNNDTTYI